MIADPRLSDEESVALTDEYRGMLANDGTTEVMREESWGKRKLAYPIEKFNEGRYHVFYIEADPKNTIPEVEQRMRQNDRVLRFLTVRTDEDIKRSESKGKKPAEAEAEAVTA
jgi:small subunit ribosomal protein S6